MWLKELSFVGLLLVVLCSSASGDGSDKVVVCYLGSWANYRQGEGKFLIENIDPFLCTHLVYGFAKLANNQIAVYDPYLDVKENWGLGAFERFNGLKKKNPKVKTLIAIGGWNEGSTKYSQMAGNAASRKTFVDSCLVFLEKYGFDGLDMDWEYPANRGGASEDKQNFILLLKDLKEAFVPKGYLLSAAVAAGKSTMDSAYDIPGMSKYLDLINVMAYDLHGSWETFTGHHAALYPREGETGDQALLNVDYAINYWINKGAPRNKIVLGMGTYGRSFTLAKADQNGMGAPVEGKGEAGPITREGGMLGYNEICSNIKSKGWKVTFHDEHKAPYAYKDRQWVGYDDIQSIEIKVDYLMKMNLGGGMIWSLETDDFRGNCHGVKYPLLTAINKKLNREIVNPEPVVTDGDRPTPPPTQSPQEGSTATDDGTAENCEKEGTFRDPNNCAMFFKCVSNGKGGFTRHNFSCGEGTAFNPKTGSCDWKENVEC